MVQSSADGVAGSLFDRPTVRRQAVQHGAPRRFPGNALGEGNRCRVLARLRAAVAFSGGGGLTRREKKDGNQDREKRNHPVGVAITWRLVLGFDDLL